MNRLGVSVVLVGASMLAGACASQRETYALAPGNTGSDSALTVLPREGAPLVLDRPGAAAVSDGRQAVPASIDEAELRARFGDAMSATPPAPRTFVLYFLEGSDELTAGSKAAVVEVFAEIRQRQAPDIVVVGHTDRVGKVEDNDLLSKRRADKVRADLVREGIPTDSIRSAGRGEREPLVPTADEVQAPGNRRVEIFVR